MAADAGVAPPELHVRVFSEGAPAFHAQVHLGPETLVSDNEGRVAFESCNLPSEPASGEEGLAPLRAELRGLTSRVKLIDCAHLPNDEIELDLKAAASIHGHARTAETHAALNGAEAWVKPSRVGRTRADDNGAFVLEGLPPGDYALHVAALGRLPVTLSAVRLMPGERRDVTVDLEAEAAVAGHVLNLEREPVADVVVRVRTLKGKVLGLERTDKDGLFRVGGLAKGQAQLTVEAPDFALKSLTVPVPSQNLEVRLSRGGTVDGKVWLHDDGAPDTGVELKVSKGGAPERNVVTNVDGAFKLELLPEGEYQVVAKKPGVGTGGASVTVRDGDVARVDVHLDEWIDSIQGEVRDAADDRLLPGVAVKALELSAVTDALGHFSLEPLPAAEILVSATAVDYAKGGALVSCPNHGFVIRLSRLLTVKGRVLDSGGEPIHAFEVCELPSTGCEPVRSADGRFRLRRGPPRYGELWVRAENYESGHVRCEGEPGEPIDLGDIRLSLATPVTAIVSGPDGQPVPGATVFSIAAPTSYRAWTAGSRARTLSTLSQLQVAAAASPDTAMGVTDQTGTARFFSSESGPLCFVARHPLFAPSSTSACPMWGHAYGSSTFALTLQVPAWVSGHVSLRGKFVEGLTVLDTAEAQSAVSDAQGNFRLGPLSAGKHVLSGMDGVPVANVELTQGQEAQVDLELQ